MSRYAILRSDDQTYRTAFESRTEAKSLPVLGRFEEKGRGMWNLSMKNEPEEEMKRFKEAISDDSGYTAVGFSYGNDSDNSAEYPADLLEGIYPYKVHTHVP